MDQFLTMAFAQLTYRESLRDIEVNLRAQAKRLYHMGLRCKTVSRNTLSNANATRPWQKARCRLIDSCKHWSCIAQIKRDRQAQRGLQACRHCVAEGTAIQ
jgi:hypothetical protein